ncbi:MAG: DUF1289 domain-containing protein [Burkholderiales bacterium]
MNSPCNNVCVMDSENRYCLGCQRTLAEIARWSEMSDVEREAVLAALPARAPLDVAEGSVPPIA